MTAIKSTNDYKQIVVHDKTNLKSKNKHHSLKSRKLQLKVYYTS